MDFGIENKTALVTGSWRGTGLGIARALLHEGAHLMIHGLEEGQAEDARAALVGDGLDANRLTAITGDIRTASGSARLLDQIADNPVDIVVNNYGTAERGRWGGLEDDDWIRAYETNVLSAVRLIEGLLPRLRQQGWGRIIQVGTIGSLTPNKVMPHYYASKGALANLTISLAKDLAGTGITVNTLSPALIKTPEVEAMYLAKARKEGWGETWQDIEPRVAAETMDNPLGRIARVEDVGALVAFLCSEQAGFLNGLNIRIDGGASGLTF